MNAPARPPRMTVPEFLDWAAGREGRYELVDGQPVGMAPERVRHTVVKFSAARALDDAVREAGLPCRVFADGVSVAIDEHTVREPDCSVQCTEPDLDSMFIDAPMIVVEVTSPSSTRDDTTAKLVEYFSVPSICHYIIVRADQSVVIHHRRDEAGAIATRILGSGDVDLTPPGISVPVARLLGAA